MAHGKETPRQKMIGMMYLVLTAMLALNVAKEVLNAFILVDNGLVTTTKNFADKNADFYTTFDEQAQLNPLRAGDWKEKADQVKARSNELYDFMRECKFAILEVKEQKSIEEGEVNWDEVHAKDNMDIPAQVMIVQGKAKELKQKINEHRDFLLSLIEEKERYSITVKAIEGALSTELPDVELEHGRNVTPTWESSYFEHLPLASVITLLSKMQADVRNAEAEMLNYLLGQITAGDIGFNKIEAVVMPERSLVFPGEEYRARIFLAAYDSTKVPKVVLDNGKELAVQDGKGIYTTTSNTLGIKTWGGTISLEDQDNPVIRKFSATFEVAEANATISATGMNVFYRGIPNPVAISAGGVAERDVVATISSGKITRIKAGVYEVKPGPRNDIATISVYANIDGSRKLMNRMDFRVYDLPKPDAIVKGISGSEGALTVGQLSKLKIVEAEAKDFVFEVDYQVESFEVAFQGQGNIWSSMASGNNRFTSDQKGIFRQLKTGQRIMIEKIRASGPDGKIRTLNNITITVR